MSTKFRVAIPIPISRIIGSHGGVGAGVLVVICVLLWWFVGSSGRDDTRERRASPVASTAGVQRGFSTAWTPPSIEATSAY